MDCRRQLEESIEVYKIREVVERLTILESVPHLADADIDSLGTTVHELEIMTSLEDYIQLDREFDLRTYSGGRMRQLLAIRRKFVNETFGRNGLPFSDPRHRLLMQAIGARDVEAAQVVVRLHICRTRLTIEGGVGAPAGSRRGASAPRVSRLTV